MNFSLIEFSEKVIRHFFLEADFFCISLTKDNNDKCDFIMREMKNTDIEYMKNEYPHELNDEKARILRDRLNNNVETTYVVASDNVIMGYCCVCIGSSYENGIRRVIHVGKDEVYLFDDYVFEKYRGKGIQTKMIQERIQIWSTKRLNAIACIHRNNGASRNNILNMGFSKIAQVTYILPLDLIILKQNDSLTSQSKITLKRN